MLIAQSAQFMAPRRLLTQFNRLAAYTPITLPNTNDIVHRVLCVMCVFVHMASRCAIIHLLLRAQHRRAT